MKYYSTCTSISDAPAEFDPFITLLLGMRDRDKTNLALPY